MYPARRGVGHYKGRIGGWCHRRKGGGGDIRLRVLHQREDVTAGGQENYRQLGKRSEEGKK